MSRSSITSQPAPAGDGSKRSTANPPAGCCADALDATRATPASATTWHRRPALELHMDPRPDDLDRPAIGVVAGVPELLIVARQPDRPGQVVAVEDLEDPLPGLAKKPVPDESVDAAHRQILRVRRRDPAHADSEPGHVEGAAPGPAFGHGADRHRTIGGVEGVDLGLPVRVHAAEEHPDIGRDVLLEIDPDPQLRVRLPNPAEIGSAGVLGVVAVEPGRIAGSCVLRRIGLERGDRVAELPGVDAVAIAE